MGRVQTSVMIDEDKRALAKQRGIKLQDLLDEALDMALDLEIPGKAQLEVEKDKLLNDLEVLDKQTEEYLKQQNAKREEINIRLKYIDKALTGANEEKREKDKLKEYKDILKRGVKNGKLDGDLYEEFMQFCIKYKIADINEAYIEANNDLVNVFYKRVKLEDITKTPGSNI